MRKFIYIIGEPGAGKTFLTAALAEGQLAHPMSSPIPHTVYGDGGVAQLGRDRGEFGGTDALGMAVQPTIEAWLHQRPYPTLFAEGDRLANAKFFAAVQRAGYDLRVIWLRTPPEIAARRRDDRAREMGRRPQNESWVRGRRSKVERLAERFDARQILGVGPIEAMVEQLRRAGLDPFQQEVTA